MSEQTTITANELLDGGLLGPAHSDTKVAPARLLEYAPGKRFALPIHTTLEIVEDPEFFHVPGVAQHGLSFPVQVKTARGYELVVDGERDGDGFASITLTGPVKKVYEGVLDWDSLDALSA